VIATDADVKLDTPEEVIQAIRDAAPYPAFIVCPKCGGTGLIDE
jgi:hypothetical protein